MAQEEATGVENIADFGEKIGKREAAKLCKRRRLAMKNEERLRVRKIREILRKEVNKRTSDDVNYLCRYPKVVTELVRRNEKRRQLMERKKEREDPPEVLRKKCDILAEAMRCSKHMVVYTGAGISTAASIPDYRGPDGVWTKLSRGEDLTMKNICDADPTLTHMCLVTLYQENMVKHIVSQNCDGLHIRSGLPSPALSEIHGNMFAEVCEKCEPQRVYWRLFDVTENTGLRRHGTDRKCHTCSGNLSDTIVHFGEKRELSLPQNWEAAFENARKTDLILCLGSSLKVLKSYHGLWGMNRAKTHRPELFIVNLQWTPKDNVASLKINGKVDDVMRGIMDRLNFQILKYNRLEDPLLKLHTSLTRLEFKSHTTKVLATKKDDAQEESVLEQLKYTSVKEEPFIKGDMSMSCDDITDVPNPGWFGKGIRKSKSRKRRK